jgi:two-component system NarL family sensor kinase
MLNNDLINFLGGTLILVLFAFTLVIFLIVHKKKRYQHLLEKQQMESNYQNQLLLSRMEVQEQSFKHFSEEIHDNIGQVLSIVKMQLHNIRSNSKETEIVTKAGDCTELLGKAITDLRNISHTLNSTFVSNAGLTDAIAKDMEYIRSAKDIDCRLNVQGEEYSFGPEQELLIFRIIQEAMGNAIKHAAPGAINVSLGYTPDKLSVTIADNGSGFEMANISSNGIGLNNMQVRSDLLKGKLEVNSVKDKGTTILLEINNPFIISAA